ncbi:MAG: polysaccharide pyruvyl transferase family protein [Lachnospiraceae bacterium]|nr:polysaccharide pyruvyl transferase family protein [Candidatus Colinaster scatohippi]
MKIIVVGGNCANKGAQALLFITMCELRKQYPEAELYFDSQEKFIDDGTYCFKHVDRRALRNALAIKAGKGGKDRMIKDAVWAVRDKRWYAVLAEPGYMKLLSDVKLIIDISGYNLASKFSNAHNELFLDIIEYAMDCGIKTVIMPQSFGPFDYKQDAERITKRIADVLSRSELVYAREPGGIEALNGIGFNKAKLSDDLVIQSRDFELSAITKKKQEIYDIEDIPGDSIAVIPNEKIFVNSSNREGLYTVYEDIIKKGLALNNKVYLIYHSVEDLAICKRIKESFCEDDRVVIIEKELAFYEYEALVKNFKYIIASRYHSIILAYRQCVPGIGIGWAEKYDYLFARCGQEKYVHGVNDVSLRDKVIEDMEALENCHTQASGIIKEKLENIQKKNCFDELFGIIENL